MPQDSTRSRSRREDQMYGAARLSPVSVRARAVVPIADGILVSRERRHGRDHVTLPGGRVDPGESAAATALREVHEETGIEIELGPLLYVAEVGPSARRQDLNLIFLARALGTPPDDVDLVRPGDDDAGIMPPILDRIWRDRANGWEEMGVWLGNVWRGDLGR
ncbi:MAG: NUDIX hydrolase [Solirubrobacterales bacterium]